MCVENSDFIILFLLPKSSFGDSMGSIDSRMVCDTSRVIKHLNTSLLHDLEPDPEIPDYKMLTRAGNVV